MKASGWFGLALVFTFAIVEARAAVDTSTLTGKVMCGYQGWFNAPGDGAERGWVHWTKRGGPLGPGNAKIDLWPDISELGAEERFPTGFIGGVQFVQAGHGAAALRVDARVRN